MAIINPPTIDVGFHKLEKIIHLSDIHIRLFKRHKEYRIAFARLYDDLSSRKFENSIILVMGDILHAKTDLSPEMIDLASEFLRKLADLYPTFVVAGNHDLNLSNSSRLDSLSPLIENISHSNLYYLKDSGIYTVADTDLALHSVVGARKDWPRVKQCKSTHRIALLHAPVNDAKTDTGFTITSRHVDISTFNGYHLVLLGDIHKCQILQDYDEKGQKPLIAYPGSMIQQNHGENLEGHGWLEWDVVKRRFEHHELYNEYGYATLIIENGKIPDLSHIPPKARLRVFVKDLDASKTKKIESILRKRFDLKEFMVNKMQDLKMGKNHNYALEMIDVHNIENQNKLIEEYLIRQHTVVDLELMTRIFEINRELNSRVGSEDLSRNVHWKPLLFEFDNMFSYGEDNVLDFESMRGVNGLFSPNASGKTAAFDALMFCLYDKTPRAFKASHIMNNRKNKFSCYLKFEINGEVYGIRRVGIRKKNRDVKVDVTFWKMENDKKVYLNAEDRRHTNAAIRKYVGTYDDFILTSLSLQHNNTLFIDKSQSERKDLLSQFIGINIFDMLYQLALDEIKSAGGALKMLTKMDTTQILVDTQTQIDVLSTEYEKIEVSVNEGKGKLGDVANGITQLYEKKTPLDIGSFNIGKLEQVRSNLISSLDFAGTDNSDLLKSVQNLKVKSGSLAESMTMYDEMDIGNRYADLVNNERKLSILEKELLSLKDQIESHQSQLDHLVSHEFDPACEFCIRNNQKMVVTAEKLTSELSDRKLRYSEIGLTVEDIKGVIDYNGDVAEDYNSSRKTTTELIKVDRKLLTIKAQLADCNSKLATEKAKLRETEQHIKTYYKSVDIIEKNAEIDMKIGELEQKQMELGDELKFHENQLRGLHGKLQVYKSNKSKILKQISEMEDLEQTIHAYQYYIEAIQRNGIPYELIAKILPSIESEVNNILYQIVDFTISLEVDGKNINGRIAYGDDRHWPLEMSSGMERFISSLAIRVALITVSNLPKPNFLIIDEGLGTLSSENLMSMNMLFSILKNQFDFLIIISHLDVVRDMVDSLMEIQLDNGYSKINY